MLSCARIQVLHSGEQYLSQQIYRHAAATRSVALARALHVGGGGGKLLARDDTSVRRRRSEQSDSRPALASVEGSTSPPPPFRLAPPPLYRITIAAAWMGVAIALARTHARTHTRAITADDDGQTRGRRHRRGRGDSIVGSPQPRSSRFPTQPCGTDFALSRRFFIFVFFSNFLFFLHRFRYGAT